MPRGTHALSALAGLGLICALSGCFNVKYATCRITCETTADCPSDLTCLVETGHDGGRCISPGTNTCFSENPDAGSDATEAGPDSTDATEAGSDADGGGPPSVLCHNNSCFTLPDAVRTKLVLLLWPSNLPAVGSTVSVWADQSGQGNDAHALYVDALPRVIADGVHLDPSHLGSGFGVFDSPSLDFGSGDFAVIVVAGLASEATPVSFFRKSDGARTSSRQISLDWVNSSVDAGPAGRPQGAVDDTPVPTGMDIPQPSVRAYTLSRATIHLELRVNEAVLGSADLPTAGLSTTNSQDAFVGVGGYFGSPVDSLEAVIAIRGSIAAADLDQLDMFLRTVFATTP